MITKVLNLYSMFFAYYSNYVIIKMNVKKERKIKLNQLKKNKKIK